MFCKSDKSPPLVSTQQALSLIPVERVEIQGYYYQDTIIKNLPPLTMRLVYSVMKSVYSMVDGNVAGARRGNTQDKVKKMLSFY
jgi:hypothetical protein